ncbi:MAG: hypothetical protein ACYS32_09565 [Planctomycetota bacterium]
MNCQRHDMSAKQQSFIPCCGKIVRVLRDGYWDRTEVIELKDGTQRVRKVSKGAETAGPWGVSTLRSEIQYLRCLDEKAAKHFPKLLSAWDDGPSVGYEAEYVQDTVTASDLAQSASLDQVQADIFQERLAQVVYEILHSPMALQRPSLSEHILHVIDAVLAQLSRQREFAPLIEASTLSINDKQVSGPRTAMARLAQDGTAARSVDGKPQVKLHGDCFLENILIPGSSTDPDWPSKVILVDPVSVAGVFEGHPLFDLVKYESYATGELLALRSEKIEVNGFGDPSQCRYVYRVCEEEATIKPFHQIDWYSRFRAAYISRYGEIDMSAYSLLDAYFALVMAACTEGLQRRGRLLKGTLALNAALNA